MASGGHGLGEDAPRRRRLGQQDERGRNRAATWYCFRMDHVQGRDLTITLTDFVGEYNDVPGSVPMNDKIRPAMSEDGQTWTHAEDMIRGARATLLDLGWTVDAAALMTTWWRIELAYARNPEPGGSRFELRLRSSDKTAFFFREPADIEATRERTVPSSVFRWPQ